MKPKVATASAVATYIARKFLRLITIIFFAIIGLLVLGIWALAYYFSSWWWVFILPIIVVVLIFLTIRWIILRIISAIYRHPFTREQRTRLDSFNEKVTGLIESRSTPLPIFALITLRDIIRHRDATTIRKLIDDSTSLKSDFADLEKHFGER